MRRMVRGRTARIRTEDRHEAKAGVDALEAIAWDTHCDAWDTHWGTLMGHSLHGTLTVTHTKS